MENGSVKVVGLALLLLGGCSTVGHQLRHITGNTQARLADDVVIERDAWGVPHIHGRSDAAVAFGVAWAMAEDDFRQVEDGYIEALGRSAYYYGERYLADDLVRAAFEVEALARAEYAREAEAGKRLLDGFAEGLNYWLRKHPETPPRVVVRYEGWMVLARARRAAASQQAGDLRLGEVAGLLGEAGAGGRAAPAGGRGGAWVVEPEHSRTGRALLLASVAGPFFGSARPYELELRSGSGWHVYGFTELGLPVPHTGHNDRLGWAQVPGSDTAVVQRLVFGNPADPLAYRVGDSWERAEAWQDTVLVNQAGGVQPRGYRFLRTRHGPVVARRGDTAFAVQLPGLAAGGSLQQWLALGRARSAEEFSAALAPGVLPGYVTVYADIDGKVARYGDGGAQLPTPPDSGWTLGALAALALGAAPVQPAEEVARLVQEWEEVGGRNTRRAFPMDTAVELLRRWEGSTHPAGTPAADGQDAAADSLASAAATLYQLWQEVYRTTYGGSPANAAAGAFPRFQALEEAVARLRRDWGTILVPWHAVARLQRPPTGAAGFQDRLPSVAVRGLPDGTRFVLQSVRGEPRWHYAVAGTAAVLGVEFTAPPRSESVVVFGQSAEPTSPHFFDQAAGYAEGRLKEVTFGVMPGGGTRYHPGQRPRQPPE